MPDSLRCSRTCHKIPGIVLYWRFRLYATQAKYLMRIITLVVF